MILTTLHNNADEIGKVGRITQDDHDHSPYKIIFGGVMSNTYYKEAAVRRATLVSAAGQSIFESMLCLFCVWK